MQGVGGLTKRIHSNVVPIRAVQADLFDAPLPANDTRRALDPKRALVKFKVRADVSGDIPLAKPKQLGLEEEDRTVPEVVTHGVPLSERAILRVIEGSDVSGHRRLAFSAEVDAAVEAFWHASQGLFGFDAAVVLLFSLLSGSMDYMRETPPEWILTLFAEEKDALMTVFSNHRDDRRVEPATPFDDEDE